MMRILFFLSSLGGWCVRTKSGYGCGQSREASLVYLGLSVAVGLVITKITQDFTEFISNYVLFGQKTSYLTPPKELMSYVDNQCYDRRGGRWSLSVSRHLSGCLNKLFERDNWSTALIITDLNVLCHLNHLKNIQSPPSGIRRVLCLISFYEISFRACEFMNFEDVARILRTSTLDLPNAFRV